MQEYGSAQFKASQVSWHTSLDSIFGLVLSEKWVSFIPVIGWKSLINTRHLGTSKIGTHLKVARSRCRSTIFFRADGYIFACLTFIYYISIWIDDKCAFRSTNHVRFVPFFAPKKSCAFFQCSGQDGR